MKTVINNINEKREERMKLYERKIKMIEIKNKIDFIIYKFICK